MTLKILTANHVIETVNAERVDTAKAPGRFALLDALHAYHREESGCVVGE